MDDLSIIVLTAILCYTIVYITCAIINRPVYEKTEEGNVKQIGYLNTINGKTIVPQSDEDLICVKRNKN
jgi:hypothetical protein